MFRITVMIEALTFEDAKEIKQCLDMDLDEMYQDSIIADEITAEIEEVK